MAFGDSFVTCDNKDQLPLSELLRGIIRKDATGKIYVNVVLDVFTDADNALAGIDCDNAQRETVETLWRKAFIFDENGNLALRLGHTNLP